MAYQWKLRRVTSVITSYSIHYTKLYDGHAGETREQRIEEFIEINPDVYVAGLREGCMFKLENEKLELIGIKSCRIFKKGNMPSYNFV